MIFPIKDLIKKRKFYKNKINNISNKKVKLHHIPSIPTNDNFKWNILSDEDKVDVINRLKNELQNEIISYIDDVLKKKNVSHINKNIDDIYKIDSGDEKIMSITMNEFSNECNYNIDSDDDSDDNNNISNDIINCVNTISSYNKKIEKPSSGIKAFEQIQSHLINCQKLNIMTNHLSKLSMDENKNDKLVSNNFVLCKTGNDTSNDTYTDKNLWNWLTKQ